MDPNLGRCSLIITSLRILINQSALLCASPSIFNGANRLCTTSSSSSANMENCIQIYPFNTNMFVCLTASIHTKTGIKLGTKRGVMYPRIPPMLLCPFHHGQFQTAAWEVRNSGTRIILYDKLVSGKCFSLTIYYRVRFRVLTDWRGEKERELVI